MAPWLCVTCVSSIPNGCAVARLPDEPFVGSGDIQSLADLGNSYEVVRTMKMAPVSKEAILRLASAVVVPVVPLMLTMMPWEDLLKKLLGILF